MKEQKNFLLSRTFERYVNQMASVIIKEQKKFLLSNAFERYVRQMVLVMLKLKDIIFKQEHPCSCPRTDGTTIWYDPCPDMYSKYVENNNLPIEVLVMCVMGDVFHEGLHGKYTICQIMQAIQMGDYQKALLNTKLRLYMKLKVLNFVEGMSMPKRKAIAELFNIVEDSAIEYKGKQLNKYISNCLTQSNAVTFATHIPFSKELVEKGKKDYELLIHAIMCYAILGSTKGRLPDYLHPTFKEIIPLIRKGRLASDSFQRFEIVKQIWAIISPYFEEIEENIEKEQGEQTPMYPKNPNQSGAGQNAHNEGAKPSQETLDEATEMLTDSANGLSEEELKEKFSSNSQIASTNEATSQNEDVSENNSNKENVTSKDMEDIPNIDNEEESLLGGMTESEYKNMLSEMKSSLSKTHKEFKQEQKDNEEAEKEELDFLCKKLDYPNSLHQNARVNLKTQYLKEDKESYLKISRENRSLITSFVKGIETMIHNRRDKVYYSRKGKLAQEKLYKVSFSQRTFKKVIEADKPDKIAIVVLVDLSGSCNGQRLENAKKACVILTEACEKLNIPIAITGHNASYPDFYFYHIKRFNGKKDKYAIPSMSCGHANRDGLALLYAAEMLKKRPEPIKMLISITDGQPSDGGYSGDRAKNDMLRIGKELERKGITLTGVAISEYQEGNDEIAKCYKNCVSCLDVKELGKHLLKVIKPLL